MTHTHTHQTTLFANKRKLTTATAVHCQWPLALQFLNAPSFQAALHRFSTVVAAPFPHLGRPPCHR